MRIGVPLELPPELLSTTLAGLAAAYPTIRAQVVHLSTAAQLSALRADQLDLGLLREHPIGPEFDAVRVVEEPVLLASNHAPNLTGPKGIRLDALAGMDWVSFPRSDSPAWYDELTAILRSHGVDPRTRRHLLHAQEYRREMASHFSTWDDVTGLTTTA